MNWIKWIQSKWFALYKGRPKKNLKQKRWVNKSNRICLTYEEGVTLFFFLRVRIIVSCIISIHSNLTQRVSCSTIRSGSISIYHKCIGNCIIIIWIKRSRSNENCLETYGTKKIPIIAIPTIFSGGITNYFI